MNDPVNNGRIFREECLHSYVPVDGPSFSLSSFYAHCSAGYRRFDETGDFNP